METTVGQQGQSIIRVICLEEVQMSAVILYILIIK